MDWRIARAQKPRIEDDWQLMQCGIELHHCVGCGFGFLSFPKTTIRARVMLLYSAGLKLAKWRSVALWFGGCDDADINQISWKVQEVCADTCSLGVPNFSLIPGFGGFLSLGRIGVISHMAH